MHIVTGPLYGQFQVCRVIPGGRPVSVGSFASFDEAMAVRVKLDAVSEDPEDEPLPEDIVDLLYRI